MPVTIIPASHGANPVITIYKTAAKSSLDLLRGVCVKESKECAELMQSSFGSDIKRPIYASANGLLHGAIMAYNEHHHLQIRPEDVWFAILSQLSFYINAHAEELRSMFVAHEGRKELRLVYMGNRYTVDYGVFAKQMGELIEKNVVDPELREWMMPAFSTTTKDDTIIASVLLMGAMQKYFSYKCRIMCGLPSVTILGEKADWELILQRLEKLKTFGDEPTQFYTLLKPVILRFIRSFDDPTSDDVINFWQRIAHFTSGGSGPSYYSGWITAFCFWDDEGGCKYPMHSLGGRGNDDMWKRARYPGLTLDDALYHRIESDSVPSGYSTVPVTVDDNGHVFSAVMIAGSVGIGCSSSQERVDALDTIHAETGWWMYEKKSDERLAADRKAEEDAEAKWYEHLIARHSAPSP